MAEAKPTPKPFGLPGAGVAPSDWLIAVRPDVDSYKRPGCNGHTYTSNLIRACDGGKRAVKAGEVVEGLVPKGSPVVYRRVDLRHDTDPRRRFVARFPGDATEADIREAAKVAGVTLPDGFTLKPSPRS